MTEFIQFLWEKSFKGVEEAEKGEPNPLQQKILDRFLKIGNP